MNLAYALAISYKYRRDSLEAESDQWMNRSSFCVEVDEFLRITMNACTVKKIG